MYSGFGLDIGAIAMDIIENKQFFYKEKQSYVLYKSHTIKVLAQKDKKKKGLNICYT